MRLRGLQGCPMQLHQMRLPRLCVLQLNPKRPAQRLAFLYLSHMNTQEIYQKYGDPLYFFILKRVRDEAVAHDVFQNTFVKIHNNLDQLKDPQRVRSWVFQIARNEIIDLVSSESKFVPQKRELKDKSDTQGMSPCCFNRFMEELPKNYKQTLQLVYVQGKKQQEAADVLGLSLANVKAHIRRAKELLKTRFVTCCQYQLDASGKLVGEPDCAHCG